MTLWGISGTLRDMLSDFILDWGQDTVSVHRTPLSHFPNTRNVTLKLLSSLGFCKILAQNYAPEADTSGAAAPGA